MKQPTILVTLICVSACSEAASDVSEPEVAEGIASISEPVPDPEPTPRELIAAATNRHEALSIARPLMADTYDKASDGAMLLAIWSAPNLKWTDVYVKKDETSFGRIKKDSEFERGKRLCYSGRIIQISRERAVSGRLYAGLLMTGRRNINIIHFFAAGSTGELVEGSWARFCGMVTGRYSYSNSGGGTSHAVQMVGMFKLPENTGG